ncbi:MAG: P-II family nitrogen regulator [Eubacteriales bacterium]|nr:P-II family nitrogen regulator [Eubacteriales bacterium]
MKKIEMIIRPEMMETVKEIVENVGAGGMTVSSVMGCGAQKGRKEVYRGTEMTINLLHKLKIEVVVVDSMADSLVDAISKGIRTGQVGDGKMFIIPIEDAVRVRTGEKGDIAL